MKTKIILFFTCATFFGGVNAQQLDIDRITSMPDLPSPYEMRDWAAVAGKYDTLVFATESSGEHFPIVSIGTSGVNYSEIAPIFMDSYVGSSSHGEQSEAINVIPAVVGASLVGIDKSSQFGYNWVEKIKDYYGLSSGENVYLNGPSDGSGNDWWYETMPNVFFYQLYDLYPDVAGFDEQFVAVADRWLQAVNAMGASETPWTVPYMNYRAFDLVAMEPLTTGVKEPEAAGAIGWILYQAYQVTQEEKYLIGCQAAIDYLDGLDSNPSYELQLPYGVLTASKLNAELGTDYDIDKMLNWCFSRGDLRGWGSVVGTWDDHDVSGLIGEANDAGDDYVFVMNGFQQVAALAPLVKYDKRYAKAIAKWILNVANASRLFYSGYLSSSQQSDYDWCSTYDPESVIAYEAIKEQWNGTALYARGDAKDAEWASTNLGVYGSSHVGYLGAVVQTTNVDGILQLDLNKTDFFGDNAYPSYLVYNPLTESQSVTIDLGQDSKDVYDAIAGEVILNAASGATEISLEAGAVRLISYIPAGSQTEEQNGKLYVSDDVLDYHFDDDYSPVLRIKSLAAVGDTVELAIADTVFCTVENFGDVSFSWYLNGELQNADSSKFVWAPTVLGENKVVVEVKSGDETVRDSLSFTAVELLAERPVIDTLYAHQRWFEKDESFWVVASSKDPKGLSLSYDWSVENGTLLDQTNDSIQVSSSTEGILTVTYAVSNGTYQNEESLEILISEIGEEIEPLVYLPLNGYADDVSGNGFETTLTGGTFVDGQNDEAEEALRFSNASDQLLVTNATSLNFSDAITISLWAYFTDFSEERFLISHGGWEERWKLSTTTDKSLRWTVNTSDGVSDLDASMELKKSTWYHIVAIYDGATMQFFVNGELDAFNAHTGTINSADVDLSLGKRLPDDEQYYLKGRLDEVKIFDGAVDPKQAEELISQWYEEPVLSVAELTETLIYPNPVNDQLVYIRSSEEVEMVWLMDLSGRQIKEVVPEKKSNDSFWFSIADVNAGIYLVKIGSSGKFLRLIKTE